MAERKLLTKYFTPKDDITPPELAVILSLVMKRDLFISAEDWDALPETVKKHFSDKRP